MAPLSGTTVLDFSTLLPGPLATLLLAEAGAEVIKIERPEGGDEIRAYPPRWGNASINFALLNRGKKSIALDLKSAAAQAKLEPLLARADVIVEQFRPGVMHRLGLSYEQLRTRFPRIIYCSITGYGQTGPRRHVAGHDLNYIGDTGLLALSHGATSQPVLPPALIADIAGGAYPAVMNILLALTERARTGSGRHLDIAMTDNLFPLMYGAIGQGAVGRWAGNGDGLVTGGSPRYRLYPTQDGALLAAAPLEQRFWVVFCDTIGLPTDQRDDRADPIGVAARVAALIAPRPAAAWRAIFATADCCCSVVATLAEAMSDAHFIQRGLFAHGLINTEGERIIALPVPIDAGMRAAPADKAAPALGADNAELGGVT